MNPNAEMAKVRAPSSVLKWQRLRVRAAKVRVQTREVEITL